MAIAMQYGSGNYGSNSRIAKSVIYKGTINDGNPVTLTLEAGGLFEIFTAEYNATTYAYRGHRARLVKMPEESLYGTVAAATVNEAASTNSGVTITMNADSTISIARSSSTYAVKYIVRSVDVYTGNVVSVNVSGGGGGGGGTGTLTQVTFDGTVYTDDGTGNVTLAETDPVFVASDAYSITSTDISNWNGKSDFSGDYDDLTNKPTIPTVPTNVSAFTNDAGYLTSAVTSFNGNTGAVTYTAPVTSVNGSTGAVTGLQTTSNLVTSVSSASTNSQYPSAKLLYDTVGNIETLLASI